MMKHEEMTYEEKANNDKLKFFFDEKIIAHIILKREMHPGKKTFFNGKILRHPDDRLWIIDDRRLGEIRISISEIAPCGVDKFREVVR